MTAALVLAFLRANWKGLAVGAVVLAFVAAIALHLHHDKAVAVALAKTQADNALWAQAYHDEKAAVDLQNASIAKMHKEAAAWEKRAQDATQEAHKANLSAQAKAAQFLAVKPKGDTVCDRAEDTAARIRKDVDQ